MWRRGSRAITRRALSLDSGAHRRLPGRNGLNLMADPLDLHELICSVEMTYRPLAEKKGIVLRANLDASLPRYVLGDTLRLRQILVNLVANAVKFTHQGHVEIRGQGCTDQTGAHWVRIAVTNTGVGIPKERQEAISESFNQLIELMGGVFGLESDEGRGCSFWFDVPLPSCPSPRDCFHAAEEPKIARKTQTRQIQKVLVVEDYPINQQIALQHLESHGYHVTLADNGAAAVKLCGEQHFDLVLMDLQMPIMDGFEATRAIRSDGLNTRTPILALTASAEARVRQGCLASSMDDVLTKPIRCDMLLSAISRWSCPDSHKGTKMAEPSFDETSFLDQFGDNRVLAVEALRQLVRCVENQLPILRRAVEDLDYESLRRESHKIKGGAAAVSAGQVSAAASRLEQAARNSDGSACQAALADLERTWEEAFPQLSPWI